MNIEFRIVVPDNMQTIQRDKEPFSLSLPVALHNPVQGHASTTFVTGARLQFRAGTKNDWGNVDWGPWQDVPVVKESNV